MLYAGRMRTTQFAVGELYHIYNRGVDKRSLFTDAYDFWRFIDSVRILNQVELVVNLRAAAGGPKASLKGILPTSAPLVRIHTYCINQNHFHLLLEPLVDDGVQKFMHRIGTAYTNYFNEKYERSGSLFQGPYKAVHVSTNEYFLHLTSYITYNELVHKNLNKAWFTRLPFSAAHEYAGKKESNKLAYTKLILQQYPDRATFLKEARRTCIRVAALREELKSYKQLCIEEKT
jgi:REP element-mobilizing transposase RayT